MENKSIELKMRDEISRLIQPITDDELHRLEAEVIKNGCANVFVFSSVIVGGHEEYKIALKLNLPINRVNIPCESYGETVVWICRNQLKRGDLTPIMQKYLIGKQSLAEQICENSLTQTVNFKSSIRERIAKEYHYCVSAVKDYELCAKTIDTLFLVDRKSAVSLLSGKPNISQRHLIAYAKLSGEQLKIQMENSASKEYIVEMPTVKSTPKFDPDAEITGLSLTIPSWVNMIEKVRINITPQITAKAADEIYDKLSGLKAAAEKLIEHITEVV